MAAVCRDKVSPDADAAHHWIVVGKQLELQAQGMQPTHRFGRRRIGCGLHERTYPAFVELRVDFSEARNRGEAPVLFNGVESKRPDVVECPRLEAGDILAEYQVPVRSARWEGRDDGFPEPRRKHIDQVHILGELRMFLSSDRAGDEHTEMPRLRVDAVDDGLIVRDQVVFGRVDLRDPAERLRRRTDVVAPGTENDDRRSDTLQVDDFACRQPDAAGCELVADKQLLDDELDFLAVEQRVASPPFLERQETLGFGIYFGPYTVELAPEAIGWVQIFEGLDEKGAVKDAVAGVAGERCEPRPS